MMQNDSQTNINNELTEATVLERLKGFYPTSTKLTGLFIGEMVGKLRQEGWDFGDFTKALREFRDDKRRFKDDGTMDNRLPAVHQLLHFHDPHITNNLVTEKQKRLWREFCNLVILYGWRVAVGESLRGVFGNTIRGILVAKGITEDSLPYTSFSDWSRYFLKILHFDGQPAEAYKYAARNAANPEAKFEYQRKAEFFAAGSVDEQRSYFPCLHELRRTDSSCPDPANERRTTDHQGGAAIPVGKFMNQF